MGKTADLDEQIPPFTEICISDGRAVRIRLVRHHRGKTKWREQHVLGWRDHMRCFKERNDIAVSARLHMGRTNFKREKGNRESERPLMHCNWEYCTEPAIKEQFRVQNLCVSPSDGLLGLKVCTGNTSDVEASPREVVRRASPTTTLVLRGIAGRPGRL